MGLPLIKLNAVARRTAAAAVPTRPTAQQRGPHIDVRSTRVERPQPATTSHIFPNIFHASMRERKAPPNESARGRKGARVAAVSNHNLFFCQCHVHRESLCAQCVRWGPLVMRGVSLVGVSQSEVGLTVTVTVTARAATRTLDGDEARTLGHRRRGWSPATAGRTAGLHVVPRPRPTCFGPTSSRGRGP